MKPTALEIIRELSKDCVVMMKRQKKKKMERFCKNKTELKDNAAMALMYEKSKNKLNAIYGMSATDMIKAQLLFCEGSEDLFAFEDKSREELHAEAARKAFFPYQWGIWCTARAWQRLQTAIDLVQYDPDGDFLYCDTDAVKYTGSVETWLRIDALFDVAYRTEVVDCYFVPQYNAHMEFESYKMVVEV